ncbi:MAG TPA: c-type cytochrome [Capsulimonadaceae bacterium]|nr:c-type cytochrome [Capsulimonadaceae bacterium]
MRSVFIILGLAAMAGPAIQAADVAAGKAAYDKSCKSCHGMDGTSNPAIAKMLKAEMRNLQSPEVQALSDDELKKVTVDGKGKMKPMPAVSGSAADIVAYMRTFKK